MTAQGVVDTVNWELFDQLTAGKGWLNDHQRAAGIGVSHSTLSRLRGGQMKPGALVIAKTMQALSGLGAHVHEIFPANEPGDAYADQVRALVDRAPVLNPSQREHIAILLAPLLDCDKTPVGAP
jgi:hypothetical protein